MIIKIHPDLELDIEEYLQAVVPSEIPHSWSDDTLLAFSIAVRTYAVNCILHPRHDDYHVCKTTHCQVYNPRKIHKRTNRAIELTKGKILLLNGRVVSTVYSAACGGRTKSSLEWTGWYHKHLQSVECPCHTEYGKNKNGHGAGLCQWGAQAFGANRFKYGILTYEDILKHYYQNCEIGGINENWS